MKVACPKCEREYVFNKNPLKEQSIFECYACHSLWNVYKEPKKNKKFKIFFTISTLLGIASFIRFYFAPPKQSPPPFILENVRWYEGKGHTIYVLGDLINPTMSSLPTMPLTITVEAPCAKQSLCKVFEWNYQIANPVLMARERISFKTFYKIPPHLQIARVIVSSS